MSPRDGPVPGGERGMLVRGRPRRSHTATDPGEREAPGVVEKHQDLVVGRRMKRRGMRWTKRGADNLLALQARSFCDRLLREWGVIAA
jgi:hypothetical protein